MMGPGTLIRIVEVLASQYGFLASQDIYPYVLVTRVVGEHSLVRQLRAYSCMVSVFLKDGNYFGVPGPIEVVTRKISNTKKKAVTELYGNDITYFWGEPLPTPLDLTKLPKTVAFGYLQSSFIALRGWGRIATMATYRTFDSTLLLPHRHPGPSTALVFSPFTKPELTFPEKIIEFRRLTSRAN